MQFARSHLQYIVYTHVR